METAINDDKHNCKVGIEDLEDSQEVAFFIDETEEDGNPITMIVVPLPD